MRGCVPRAAGSGRASATRQEVMPRKAMKRPQPEHRVGERPVRFIQAERRVPDRVEHPGERHDTEARRGKADRARDREGDDREAERRTEPSAQIRREGDIRERDGGAQVHRVDEEVWQREEVFERVRRVPAAVPVEADAECEEIQDDGKPQKSVRGREAGVFADRFDRADHSRAHVVDTLEARPMLSLTRCSRLSR